MGARARAVCPVCAKPVSPRAENRNFPFCSPPCKLVDLGRWLDGNYRIPGEPVQLDGDQTDESSRDRPRSSDEESG